MMDKIQKLLQESDLEQEDSENYLTDNEEQ